jgi:hypothetical protein
MRLLLFDRYRQRAGPARSAVVDRSGHNNSRIQFEPRQTELWGLGRHLQAGVMLVRCRSAEQH